MRDEASVSTYSHKSTNKRPVTIWRRIRRGCRRCSRFTGGFEPKAINFLEICHQRYGNKQWRDLSQKQQVQLIRIALQKDHFLLDPHSEYMKYWDLVISVALVFTGVVTPYEVIYMKPLRPEQALFIIDRLIDLIFVKDMLMQFFLKVEIPSKGKYGTIMLKDPKSIRMRYFRGWFSVDVVSIIPFDVIMIFVERAGRNTGVSKIKILRCIRLLRLVKLVRILRTSRLILRWQNYLAVSFAAQKLAKFSFVLFVCSHWMACFWGLVGISYGKELCDADGNQVIFNDQDISPEEVSWVTNVFLTVKKTPDDPCDGWNLYIASLHWSVMTITSIGYGDIYPVRNIEYCAGILCMLAGGVLWAYIIGSTSAILSNLDPVESNFETNTDLLNVMMKEANVPAQLRKTYREYLREAKAFDSMEQFRTVAQRFSPQLKGELLLHVSSAWKTAVFYLRSAPERLVMDMADRLDPKFFSRKEPLHGVNNSLCIIERGTLVSAGSILMPGGAFNIDFIVNNPLWRVEKPTVSLTYCLVMCLSREKFFELLERYPDYETKVRKVATKMAILRAVKLCADRGRAMSRVHAEWPSLVQVFQALGIQNSLPGEFTPQKRVGSLVDFFGAQSPAETPRMPSKSMSNEQVSGGSSSAPPPPRLSERAVKELREFRASLLQGPVEVESRSPSLTRPNRPSQDIRDWDSETREHHLDALEASLAAAAVAASAQLAEVQRRIQEMRAARHVAAPQRASSKVTAGLLAAQATASPHQREPQADLSAPQAPGAAVPPPRIANGRHGNLEVEGVLFETKVQNIAI